MLLKQNSVYCLLSLIFLFHTTHGTATQTHIQADQIAQKQPSQHTPETIISVDIKNVIFFAAQPPQNKITHTGQKFIAQELLPRFTQETDAWYAQDCENNKLLNNLVDTVIHYFTINNLNNLDNKNEKKQKILVFDIDDTVMTFYRLYFKKITHAVKTNTQISRTPTTQELYDDTFAIRPMFRLYQFFLTQGFKIAFVTARPEVNRKLTQDQLKMLGYNTHDQLYLLPDTWKKSPAEYKEWARDQLSQSYEIIATLDDDWRNLNGKHVGRCAIWVPTVLEERPGESEYFKSLETALRNNKDF